MRNRETWNRQTCPSLFKNGLSLKKAIDSVFCCFKSNLGAEGIWSLSVSFCLLREFSLRIYFLVARLAYLGLDVWGNGVSASLGKFLPANRLVITAMITDLPSLFSPIIPSYIPLVPDEIILSSPWWLMSFSYLLLCIISPLSSLAKLCIFSSVSPH